MGAKKQPRDRAFLCLGLQTGMKRRYRCLSQARRRDGMAMDEREIACKSLRQGLKRDSAPLVPGLEQLATVPLLDHVCASFRFS